MTAIKPIYLPARLFASIPWWIEAIKGDCVHIGGIGRWNKRDKLTHRYEIADVRGRLALTVPVSRSKDTGEGGMRQMLLSSHGDWWHVHRVTLESAYGRTPFFEHYFPNLAMFFDAGVVDRFSGLCRYVEAVTAKIMTLLGQPAKVELSDDSPTVEIDDYLALPEYYQVRREQLGFIGGLSILDLLFNLGPEALLYLRSLAGLQPDGRPWAG